MAKRIRIVRNTALSVVVLVLLAAAVPPARAALVAESSDFGANTVTRDTATGLGWLDLTLTLNRTYASIYAAMGPGEEFDGYRFATGNEVDELWENAGIDASSSLYDPANYAPVVALAQLVGQTGANGNCGSGCTSFYTEGYIFSGDPPPAMFLSYAEMIWFDNTTGLNPSHPLAPIARVGFPTSTNDTAKATRGAWLVQTPEPDAVVASGVAAAVLAGVRARRRPR
jgi:hypothetical protein